MSSYICSGYTVLPFIILHIWCLTGFTLTYCFKMFIVFIFTSRNWCFLCHNLYPDIWSVHSPRRCLLILWKLCMAPCMNARPSRNTWNSELIYCCLQSLKVNYRHGYLSAWYLFRNHTVVSGRDAPSETQCFHSRLYALLQTRVRTVGRTRTWAWNEWHHIRPGHEENGDGSSLSSN